MISKPWNHRAASGKGAPERSDRFSAHLLPTPITPILIDRGARQQQTREEFVVTIFVEPRAFDVEEPEAGDKARQGKRIDSQLRNGLVGARIGLVVKDVDRAVAGLQEVDVARDVTRLVAGIRVRRIKRFPGYDRDAVFVFKRRDVVFAKPDRNLNGNRNAVVGQHKALQFGMAVAVRADARNYQRRRVGGGVALFHDDEVIEG